MKKLYPSAKAALEGVVRDGQRLDQSTDVRRQLVGQPERLRGTHCDVLRVGAGPLRTTPSRAAAAEGKSFFNVVSWCADTVAMPAETAATILPITLRSSS